MYDRMPDAGPPPVDDEPAPGIDRVTRRLRWLGVILPLVLSYPIAGAFIGLLGHEVTLITYQGLIALAGLIWLGITVTLLVRRDARGAAAVTAVYLIADAWWWLLALRVIKFD